MCIWSRQRNKDENQLKPHDELNTFPSPLLVLLVWLIGPSSQVSFSDFYNLMTKGKSAATTAATSLSTPGSRRSSATNGPDTAVD